MTTSLTDEAIIIPVENLSDLEASLGAGHGFLEALKSEDDWSFIIKSHALLEAGLTTLITEHLGHPELCTFVEYLETSNNRTGKIALISNQGLLTKNQITFIKKLSELRNHVVHKVSNVNFTFNSYFKELNKDKLKSMSSWVIYYPVSIEMEGKEISNYEVFRSSPKLMLWMGLLEVLSRINIQLILIKNRNA